VRATRTGKRPDDRGVALYQVVLPHEGFRLLRRAQEITPGAPRRLFLDIEGHRQADGQLDAHMCELQQAFLRDVLEPFLTEAHCPLVTFPNPQPQHAASSAYLPSRRGATRRTVRCGGSGCGTSMVRDRRVVGLMGFGVVLAPKCPACLAAYLTVGGLGVGAATMIASLLPPLGIAIAALSLVAMVRPIAARAPTASRRCARPRAATRGKSVWGGRGANPPRIRAARPRTETVQKPPP